ncbi:VanZ family protein [Actinomadura syzygii]|uniref:VanZ family protein n=1 Tax=Actinomadura syzygii TaxID=1427538 RepID=A0A5D0UG17_9ACTN|nr:VanZ family protein [Actinomadura syzygii]TYC16069.1 VanZ family protein [Actinomadura syzygii]
MIRGWQSLAGTFTGVVFITVAVLPLAALAVWVLAHRRKAAGATSARAWRTSLADVGILYGTAPGIWMIMLPGPGAGIVPGRVSLVPLRDLATMPTGQVVGNLLVFAALGFLVPLRFPALASVTRILLLGAGCSALVETAQYVLWLDRVSSVDDVLLNASGAGLAALASRWYWRSSSGADEPGSHAATATGRSYAG